MGVHSLGHPYVAGPHREGRGMGEVASCEVRPRPVWIAVFRQKRGDSSLKPYIQTGRGRL